MVHFGAVNGDEQGPPPILYDALCMIANGPTERYNDASTYYNGQSPMSTVHDDHTTFNSVSPASSSSGSPLPPQHLQTQQTPTGPAIAGEYNGYVPPFLQNNDFENNDFHGDFVLYQESPKSISVYNAPFRANTQHYIHINGNPEPSPYSPTKPRMIAAPEHLLHVSPFFPQTSGHLDDPNILAHSMRMPPSPGYGYSMAAPAYPNSPAATVTSHRNGSTSPYASYSQSFSASVEPVERRPSLTSDQSSAGEDKEKQLCTWAGCHRSVMDLKAHLITHQEQRPERCPIKDCHYFVKGFARKYDRNRHTLTHYKGTLVCPFCDPIRAFNRTDVLKKHLAHVHHADQNAPNSRKRKSVTPGTVDERRPPGTTSNCTTCSGHFECVQEYYDHLEDCVLYFVQKVDPAEAINENNLAEVDDDPDVLATLQKNNVLIKNEPDTCNEELDAEGELDFMEEETSATGLMALGYKTSARGAETKSNSRQGVKKAKGMTHSRGVFSISDLYGKKGRKTMAELPSSWGCDPSQMTTKKRTAVVFDGRNRVVKDEMALSLAHEVHIHTPNGGTVTDLDYLTLARTEAFHNTTQEETGLYLSDNPTQDEAMLMLQGGLDVSAAEGTNTSAELPPQDIQQAFGESQGIINEDHEITDFDALYGPHQSLYPDTYQDFDAFRTGSL